MNKGQLDDWATKLGQAWSAQDPGKAMDLVSKDSIEWYENPLQPPYKSWEEVRKLWEAVPFNQKDVTYSHQVLICNDSVGIINWQVKLTKVPSGKKLNIDGIFQVLLDEAGCCTYFKQWEVESERDFSENN